jgi:hypothetical protein
LSDLYPSLETPLTQAVIFMETRSASVWSDSVLQ